MKTSRGRQPMRADLPVSTEFTEQYAKFFKPQERAVTDAPSAMFEIFTTVDYSIPVKYSNHTGKC